MHPSDMVQLTVRSPEANLVNGYEMPLCSHAKGAVPEHQLRMLADRQPSPFYRNELGTTSSAPRSTHNTTVRGGNSSSSDERSDAPVAMTVSSLSRLRGSLRRKASVATRGSAAGSDVNADGDGDASHHGHTQLDRRFHHSQAAAWVSSNSQASSHRQDRGPISTQHPMRSRGAAVDTATANAAGSSPNADDRTDSDDSTHRATLVHAVMLSPQWRSHRAEPAAFSPVSARASRVTATTNNQQRSSSSRAYQSGE